MTRDDVFPGHGTVGGWPSAKDEQMSVAQELAAAARLVLKPDVVQT